MPLASVRANKRYTPPIRYVTLTLIGGGSKVPVSPVSIGCHSCYQAACLFGILFSDVIDSWMALTFRRKHAACYYACINILINTRCSIGKVITCHHFSASSKKSLPCNCSVIYPGRICYIPQRLCLFKSLHLLFKTYNIPSQGLLWSKINLAI